MPDSTQHPPNHSALFGVLAVLIAAATAGGAWWVINGYQVALEAARNPAETMEVLSAARDLNPGVVIEDTDLVTLRIPAGGVAPDQYFASRDELIGGTVAEHILSGEPIRRQRLDAADGLDDTLLEPGTRAVTLRVDRAAGVGGLIVPGCYVDVIVTIRPDENAQDARWVTETILQAVRVLAVGDNSVASKRPSSQSANSRQAGSEASSHPRELFATLEVEPEEAEKLAMATTRGDVYLSLRSRNDFDLLVNTAPLVTNALVGIDAKPSPARAERLARRRVQAAPPPAPEGTQAEVISGSNVKVEHFSTTGRPPETPKQKK